MRKYASRRLPQLIPMLLGVTFLSFAMMRLAGSDAVEELYANAGAAVSRDVLDAARAELGLDKPFLTQYLAWLWGMLRGDMGVSYISGRDVFHTFVSKLPATLLLAGLSVLLTAAVSIPLGVLAAVAYANSHDERNPFLRALYACADGLIRFLSFIGNALPNFFAALLLMHLFSIRLGLLPVIATGVTFQSAIMPTLTLSIAMSAKYLRQIRAAVLEELHQDYVLGAQARGVRPCVILWGSVIRASMPHIVTLLALSVGSLLGGTAIVESIFMWDGVGKLAVDAILMRDYPLIQAYVVWMAMIYVLVNLAADLLCHAFDPRIRMGVDAE